jgi:hypothetical protein
MAKQWGEQFHVGNVTVDVTPQAWVGGLVDNCGVWRVVRDCTAFNQPPFFFTTDNATPFVYETTPLAPPPSKLYSLWDALLALRDALTGECGMNAREHEILVFHTRDIVSRISVSGQRALVFYSSPVFRTPDELALLDTARQQYGALLEYCKLWEMA